MKQGGLVTSMGKKRLILNQLLTAMNRNNSTVTNHSGHSMENPLRSETTHSGIKMKSGKFLAINDFIDLYVLSQVQLN